MPSDALKQENRTGSLHQSRTEQTEAEECNIIQENTSPHPLIQAPIHPERTISPPCHIYNDTLTLMRSNMLGGAPHPETVYKSLYFGKKLKVLVWYIIQSKNKRRRR